MILLLFGAPGSGKGTQSSLLVDRLGFFQISTGDLLRSAIREGTSLGRDAKDFMDKGELVPDSIVIGLVDEVLTSQIKADKRSFIFDGFPRTLAQAKSLSGILNKHGLEDKAAVFINVDRSGLVARLTGRRVCSGCGSVFHVQNKPSRVEGICDKCGGQLITRSDDREEVIVSRLDTYESVANLLKEYYSKDCAVVDVDGDQAVESVYEGIVSKVNILET